jgi:predicted RNA binding protein YcfA (HicA-like mRNA interferase family)
LRFNLPEPPRLNSQEAESLLLTAGFEMLRSSGGHRINFKKGRRVVAPFPSGKALHPTVVKKALKAIESTELDS